MIIKFLGMSAIVLSSYLLGESKAYEYRERVAYLECMQTAIAQLENEIRYTKTPLSVAFRRCAECTDGVVSEIFASASLTLEKENSKPISSVWKDAVKRFSADIFKEDIALFTDAVSLLGSSDVEGQLKHIGLFFSRLEQTYRKAREQSDKNIKLYKNLGLYAGILVAVLFV